MDLQVRNSGDAPALSVTPVLRFRDREVRGTSHPRLEPNGTFDTSLAVAAGEPPAGRWPYQIAVDYTDANEYPSQALSVATLTVGSPPPTRVAVTRFEGSSISESADLELEVKNLSATERGVWLALVVPHALEATNPPAEVVLAPWEQRTVALPLRNRSAVVGSRYPVFLTVEYDEGGVHQVLVRHSMVEILAVQPVLRRYGRALWLGAGVLGAVFVGLIAARLARS